MACNARNLYFVVFVAAIALSVSNGDAAVIINGTLIPRVNITGRLFCSPNGNPIISIIPTRPLSGANVTLMCQNGAITLGSMTTNGLGVFNFMLNGSNAFIFDTATCTVSVALPMRGCIQLPTTGTLTAAMTLLNGVGSTLGALGSSVVGGVGSTVGGVGSTVGGVVGGVVGSAGSTVGGLGTTAGNVVNGVANVVPGLFNRVNCLA